MKKLIYLFACTGALVFQSCGQRSDNAADTTDTIEMATDSNGTSDIPVMESVTADTSFTNKAAIGGMAEVQFGKLALQKGTSPKVKDFATMMVKDHGKANEELKSIAMAKGLVLPTELDADHLAVQKELETKTGVEFEKAYIKAMVDGHQKTLALMEDGSTNLSDAELKAFAGKTAPVVKHHLDMITKMQAEMK